MTKLEQLKATRDATKDIAWDAAWTAVKARGSVDAAFYAADAADAAYEYELKKTRENSNAKRMD